MGQSSSS